MSVSNYNKPTEKDKLIKRSTEIYEEAIGRYLDKTDADVTEYMTPEERVEYRKGYMVENDSCPFCGETKKDCQCEEGKK